MVGAVMTGRTRVIELQEVHKSYQVKGVAIPALAGVDMKTLARFTHNLLISVANANQTPRILPCPCSWSAKMKRWAYQACV